MKRKGFTLVELLIVIVVIGILSAMMMLSSTEAVTSARASNIVSNLRNFKTAALALYVDKLDTWEGTTTAPTFKELIPYMNSTNSNTGNSSTTAGSFAGYDIVTAGDSGAKAADKSWYVAYGKVTANSTNQVVTTTIEDRVKTKLAGRAKSVGLFNATKKVGTNNDGTPNLPDTYTNGDIVYMLVR